MIVSLIRTVYFLRLKAENTAVKGRPHGRTQGCFASYFCSCTTFSASYTYKSTSTTSSDSVGFFVRRTRVRRTYVRACFIQMGLLSPLAFQIKRCFYKINTINCFIY